MFNFSVERPKLETKSVVIVTGNFPLEPIAPKINSETWGDVAILIGDDQAFRFSN
jgi:hypothetical protein